MGVVHVLEAGEIGEGAGQRGGGRATRGAPTPRGSLAARWGGGSNGGRGGAPGAGAVGGGGRPPPPRHGASTAFPSRRTGRASRRWSRKPTPATRRNVIPPS